MSAPMAWLPPEVLVSDPIRQRLDQAVADWSKTWFAGATVRASSLAVEDAPAGGAAEKDRQASRGGVNLSFAARGQHRLWEWALNVASDQVVRTTVDDEVLGGLMARILSDLEDRLGRAFGQSLDNRAAAEPARPVVRAALADELGRQLGVVNLPAALVISAFKISLGAPDGVRTALANWEKALGATPIRLDAILGEARLPVGDLQTIAKGDVLILDTDVSGEAELKASGQSTGLRGKPIETDGQVSLALSA